MITVNELSDLSPIADQKAAYLESLIAPMDGMWDVGFTNVAPHWEIRVNDKRAGYYAVNDEGALLQFFVSNGFLKQAEEMFDYILALDSVRSAVVSTIDPLFMSLCLDRCKSVVVHTLMYELLRGSKPEAGRESGNGKSFRRAEKDELERVVELQRICLGGDDNLSEWLRGYSTNLIARSELFVLVESGTWLGLGECRGSDTQKGVADLGMMVDPSLRGRGLASEILERLVELANGSGLTPICSTTVENIAARKAIARAGFVSRHRIANVTF